MRYAENQRHEFISELLKTQGFLNRSDLIDKFEIGLVQASRDINNFMKSHPSAMKYNLQNKRYESNA